jgi:hypothetical protein
MIAERGAITSDRGVERAIAGDHFREVQRIALATPKTGGHMQHACIN